MVWQASEGLLRDRAHRAPVEDLPKSGAAAFSARKFAFLAKLSNQGRQLSASQRKETPRAAEPPRGPGRPNGEVLAYPGSAPPQDSQAEGRGKGKGGSGAPDGAGANQGQGRGRAGER